MGRVDGKVALVTGAAQGIGRAIAELLAREGGSVVVTDVQDALGERVAEEICGAAGMARYRRLDVASEQDWHAAIEETVSELGGLHILVNNAGIALQKDILATSFEEWRHLMSINLDGVFLGTKAAIPAIAASGGGSIVNMSSVAGIVAHGDLAAYSASKGGVHLLSKAAAISCGRAGLNVRVNSVHPAFLRTELLDEYLAAREDPEATLAGLVALHPIGRLGDSEDVALGVLYLASDDSRWVTGTELVIDGGYMAE